MKRDTRPTLRRTHAEPPFETSLPYSDFRKTTMDNRFPSRRTALALAPLLVNLLPLAPLAAHAADTTPAAATTAAPTPAADKLATARALIADNEWVAAIDALEYSGALYRARAEARVGARERACSRPCAERAALQQAIAAFKANGNRPVRAP